MQFLLVQFFSLSRFLWMNGGSSFLDISLSFHFEVTCKLREGSVLSLEYLQRYWIALLDPAPTFKERHHIVLWSLEMRHFSQSVCPNCILPTCLQEYWGEHVKCLVKAKVQSIRNSSFIHWTSGFVTESITLAKHNLHLVNLSWGFPAIFFLVFHKLGKHFHKHLFHNFPQKCSETDSSAVSQIFIFVDRYNICPFPVT